MRDWLYVEDHCDAISLILRAGKPGETYNVGGSSEKTNIDKLFQMRERFKDSAK